MKTVKMAERPTVEQLRRQLPLISTDSSDMVAEPTDTYVHTLPPAHAAIRFLPQLLAPAPRCSARVCCL